MTRDEWRAKLLESVSQAIGTHVPKPANDVDCVMALHAIIMPAASMKLKAMGLPYDTDCLLWMTDRAMVAMHDAAQQWQERQ